MFEHGSLNSSHNKIPGSADQEQLSNLLMLWFLRAFATSVQSIKALRSPRHTFNRQHSTKAAMPDQIEVLLHGLGAIGSFYAFILQRCKHVRLSVTARSNYEAVRANGLLMKSDNHGEHRFYPAATLKAPSEAGHAFDFIVCTSKATDLGETAEQLAAVVDEDRTTIVLLQNGVGNEDPFRARFPRCPILSGVVSHTSFMY